MTLEEWWKEYSKDLVLYSYTGTASFPEAAAKAAWKSVQSQDQLKPNWEDAPEWAEYLAMDEDGGWFWYEKEPEPAHDERVFRNADVDDTSRFESAKVFGVCWYKSLEKKP